MLNLNKIFLFSIVVFVFASNSVLAAKRTRRKTTVTETVNPTQPGDSSISRSITSSNEWTTVLGKKSGMDQKGISKLYDLLRKMNNVQEFAVAYNGNLVASYGDLKVARDVHGCAHGIMGIIYGIFIENKVIRLNQTIGEMQLNDFVPFTEQEKKIRLDQILSCRSGIFRPTRNDMIPLAMQGWKNGSVKPGTLFVPNHWDMNFAETYLRQVSSRKNMQKLIQFLFVKQLNMQDFSANAKIKTKEIVKIRTRFLHDPQIISARDILRIGELLRGGGRWGRKQIVSEQWIKRMTTPIPDTADAPEKTKPLYNKNLYSGFGYCWWCLKEDNFTEDFRGAYSTGDSTGTYLTILPEAGMTVFLRSKNNMPVSPETYRKILYALLKCRLKR